MRCTMCYVQSIGWLPCINQVSCTLPYSSWVSERFNTPLLDFVPRLGGVNDMQIGGAHEAKF